MKHWGEVLFLIGAGIITYVLYLYDFKYALIFDGSACIMLGLLMAWSKAVLSKNPKGS
jgi:hypothetical protein